MDGVIGKFSVEHDVRVEDVQYLLCSALSGGSNYWYLIDRIEYPPNTSPGDFGPRGCMQHDPDRPRSPYEIVPFIEGGRVLFRAEDLDGVYVLDLSSIRKGLRLMAEKHTFHFSNLINDNADAETGDVFLQLCLFEDVVFG